MVPAGHGVALARGAPIRIKPRTRVSLDTYIIFDRFRRSSPDVFQRYFDQVEHLSACPVYSGSSKLRCVERLKRIDISYGLRLLVPFEIAQRYVFGCEVSDQEAVLLDRRDGFFHV